MDTPKIIFLWLLILVSLSAVIVLYLFKLPNFNATQEIKIAAASAVGEYTQTLIPALSAALYPYGYRAVAVASAGSQENIDQVQAGILTAALTQFDVAALNIKTDDALLLLGKLTPEALFCVAPKAGRIKRYADLVAPQPSTVKTLVGAKHSGTAQTLHYLTELDPRLKQNLHLIYQDNFYHQLLTPAPSWDLGCFVMMPNPRNQVIQSIVAAPHLAFVPIDNPSFQDAQIGDLPVYALQEVPISGTPSEILNQFRQPKTLKTLVTWVGIIVNSQHIDPALLAALQEVVQQKDLLPPESLSSKVVRILEHFAQMTH